MNIQPRIVTLAEKKLIGMHISMSLGNNRTPELWRNFMPRRKEILNKVNADLISMQVLPASVRDIAELNMDTPIQKWAAVEVTDFGLVPEGMECFVIPAGLYAVFPYVGPASDGARLFGYIYGEWMPGSGYVWENRPQFEVLGVGYKHDAADSEEDVWVPVRQKTI